MEATVQKDPSGDLYVEADGHRFTSLDLPGEGTDVVVDTYTGINDCYYADITWSADTPSGRAFCLAVEIW